MSNQVYAAGFISTGGQDRQVQAVHHKQHWPITEFQVTPDLLDRVQFLRVTCKVLQVEVLSCTVGKIRPDLLGSMGGPAIPNDQEQAR